MILVDYDANSLWPDLAAGVEQAAQTAVAGAGYADWLTSPKPFSVSISLSADDTVHSLNRDYRGKDKPTNVLSFPMVEADDLPHLAISADPEIMLGDIILAYETCAAEAANKRIPLADHVTHLIIHGVLHLLGYDHMDDVEAAEMEALEIKALASLGLDNPYSDDVTTSERG